ncbi:MAG: 39S ribosomal protein L45 [Desulfovibrio sp.]|jgi:predicted lipid-binding transport protein (Tim44 family)|nr:39S ribosomal protein L45 [Desulfovibrio sp.]
MKLCNIIAIFVLALGMFIAAQDCAEAARLGGGRSFGGKPYMSTPAPPPPAMRQGPAAQAQSSRDAGAVGRPSQTQQGRGLFGGMGGLFGGLLAGTLIGSLLSGHGFSGGGFLDILLIGLLIYLALKFFAGRRRPAEAAAGRQGAAFTDNRDFPSEGDSGWDRLRSGAHPAPPPSRRDIPADFDAEEFLRGAKMAYTRLQASWDKRDLEDIAHFATPAVLEKIREDMAAAPSPGATELLLVNARLLCVEKTDGEERAEVFFDVLMRESPDQPAPASVKEIWHFLRSGSDGSWKLDGIQQVE